MCTRRSAHSTRTSTRTETQQMQKEAQSLTCRSHSRRLRKIRGEDPEPEVGGVLPVLPLRAACGQLEACRLVSVPRGILLRQGELHGGALAPPTLADASSRRLLRTPRAGLGQVCASGRGSACLCGPMGRKALQVHIQCEPAEVLVINPLGLGQDDGPQQRRDAALAEPVQGAVDACRVQWVFLVPSWAQLLIHSESRQPKPSWHPLTCSQ